MGQFIELATEILDSSAGRIVSFRHRIKKTADGDAHPTQVAILYKGELNFLDLEDEDSELDFVCGRFPIAWRAVTLEDDLDKFNFRHLKWKKLKKGEEVPEGTPERFSRKENEGKKDEQVFILMQVPEVYEGLKAGDRVVMVLGGSGDMLAYALSRMGQKIGSEVFRMTPFDLKSRRPKGKEEDKTHDAELLAKTFVSSPNIFYAMRPRDAKLTLVRECWRQCDRAMNGRIAGGLRLRQLAIGRVYRDVTDLNHEISIEKDFDEKLASDEIFKALLAVEAETEKQLEEATEATDVYQTLFEPIKGVGYKIASRLISAIQDIRRFDSKTKLKKFCGVHVLPDGRFPRRKAGELANWNPDARQALYLFGEQMNRRPDSVWGKIFNAYKVRLRAKHPEVTTVDGKKRYSNGHIHKMALWRTFTKFIEWLWREWWRLEGRKSDRPSVPDSLSWADPALYRQLAEKEGWKGPWPEGFALGEAA